MFIKEILLGFFIIFIVRLVWKWKRFFYLASKIPKSQFDFSWQGVKDAFNADNRMIFKMIYESFDGVNGLAKTWLGPMLFVIISSPEDVKIVMNSKECLDKPYFIRFPGPVLKGTLFGDIEFWHKHRKILDPYFGVQKLKRFIDLFDEKSKVLTKNVAKMLDQGDFDIFHYMTALTLETILNAMEFEIDIQNQESKVRDLTIEGLEIATKLVTQRIFRFYLHPEFIYRQTKMYVTETKAKAHSAFSYTDDVINNIRIKLKKNHDEVEEDKPTTFMRALVSSKFNLDESEIRDEVKTLLIAAQDTTAISMSATLLLLAMHKDKQAKVIDEMHRVIGNNPDIPFTDFDKLNELHYLEMVINEALRLMPVVPFVFRSVDSEITSHEGYIIPPNANLIIPIFKIQRNKTFWGEDANKFRPERFEKENIKKVNSYAFLPFTKGPRICLGWRYAMMLMKIQLCNFLMRYEVDTSLKYEELEFELNVTLNICQGFKISIKERKER
ncbi:hypothetical protein PVAND_001091 [Polypedilum vanderplanki]|uniref:Cytochrome P450 n=1 Tax=Polypedilum vanderplanki TaxID=319348 RepID=A0A9J6BLV9_POLVA|nr:hypothetical protein PVAND_001091 [Polypedilum vanderplanki]